MENLSNGKLNITELVVQDATKQEQLLKVISDVKNGSYKKDIRFDPSLLNASYLPGVIGKGVDKLVDPIEKQVYLISSLAVVSGLLPNVIGFYDNKYYHPNLFVYLLGKYGTGKGTITFAKDLGKLIHNEKLDRTRQAYEDYERELQIYEKAKKEYHKKNNTDDPPKKPEQPPQLMLYIPVDSSKSGIIKLLNENNGEAILFETEGDTLVTVLKQDFGNFSDILRKSFHHEPVSLYRRTNSEFREIESPKLSIILSSTFDQLTKLIPDSQNGLFSRFCFFILPRTEEFKNVFNNSKQDYPQFFESLAYEMKELYDKLSALDEPVKFNLSKNQQEKFLQLFSEWKKELGEYVSEDLDGSVNRLGLIFFRIAMILSILRAFDKDKFNIPRVITCEDTDFETSYKIVSTLKQTSLRVFYMFPEKTPLNTEDNINKKAQLVAEAIKLREQGFTYQKIADAIGEPKTTVYRWLNS